MNELLEFIRQQTLKDCLGIRKCEMAYSARLILLATVRQLGGRFFSSRTKVDPSFVPQDKQMSIDCLRMTSSSLLHRNCRRLLTWFLIKMAKYASEMFFATRPMSRILNVDDRCVFC
jgi:hypothetical protein